MTTVVAFLNLCFFSRLSHSQKSKKGVALPACRLLHSRLNLTFFKKKKLKNPYGLLLTESKVDKENGIAQESLWRQLTTRVNARRFANNLLPWKPNWQIRQLADQAIGRSGNWQMRQLADQASVSKCRMTTTSQLYSKSASSLAIDAYSSATCRRLA